MTDVSPTSVTTHWDAPRSESDHKINRYQLELVKDSSLDKETKSLFYSTPSNSPNQLSHKFINLVPGRYYGIKVRVVYEINGYGPWSGITFFETKNQETPNSPTQLKVLQVQKQTAQIYWEAPSNYKEIVEYDILTAVKGSRPLAVVHAEGSANDFVITGLESGTTYTSKLRAVGQHDIAGKWSVEIALTTSKY